MNDTALAEYAAILWVVNAGVAMLTAYVTLGWLARARRRETLLESGPSQLLAAATLGTGICASSVLGMLSEGLPYSLGYGAVAAGVLWLGAIIGCMVVVAGLTRWSSWWMVVAGALALAALAAGLQMGWIWGAGFRPGVIWNRPLIGAGAAVVGLGSVGALFAAINQGSRRRYDAQAFARRGASVLLGLSVLAGQQLVVSSADLGSQSGSVYRNQVPGTIIGLGCGVLVPLTLVIMSVDLSMRNRQRQRSISNFSPNKRRKRRHRVRTL